MKTRVVWDLLRRTYETWSAANAPRLGAALAYYALFSMAPVLLLAIAIAGLVFGEAAARGEVVRHLTDVVGQTVAEALEGLLKQSSSPGSCASATIIGLGMLLFGASGLLSQLQDALNAIWGVTPKPGRSILGIVRERCLSFLLVLATGFLLVISLVLSTALAAAWKLLTPAGLPPGAWLWQPANFLVSLACTALLVALMFKILPDVHLAWRHLSVGAAATALLFTLGEHLVGWYLAQSTTTSVFGAAGSLVVILLWVYYSAQILLFGAAFTRVYADHAGSPVAPTDSSAVKSRRAKRSMPAVRRKTTKNAV